MKQTPERKLKKVVIDLMRNPIFADMSGIFMLGSKQVVDNIPTACTNGRDELYGTKFVEMLDHRELAFVVVHESYHKMLRHLTTWGRLHKEDPMLANMAMDYVINLAIVNRDPNGTIVAMPKIAGKQVGLLDTRFANMNTKQVFDILKQEKKDNAKGKGEAGDGEAGDGGGGNGNFDEHDWEGAQELSKEEVEQLVKEVDQAIRQGQITAQKLHGKGGGNMDRELMDLLNPKVDWREVMREFVTAVCKGRDYSSWRKPNRRFLSEDIIMPSLVGERVGHIVVGIDTSGSIGGPELARFLSEVMAVAEQVNPDKVDLIYWDAHVAGHEVYNDATLATLVDSTKPKGGGGTDPTCVPAYLAKHGIKPECVLMLTDGYVCRWGDWDAPVLWCICGGNKVVAPIGKTVHVEN
jgi:predicted metal-dependent peptidase